ncbi:MAG: leucine-rich repeat domain-containing protein [Spirochaetia bacterium]|nr:leucine-rich repeat domain-containing protein [Spirochaetia bacterium]
MNHKFTTIAWGLVFIIILFCGCSNMVETLRALSDAELSVVLLCDGNTNATNIEIPLGEAQSFSFIVKDKNTGEIIDNVYFLKDIQWGYPKKPLENSDTIEVSFPENKHTMTVRGVKATETPNEIYVTVNGVKSNVCTVTVQDEPIEPEKEIKVILTSNDQQVDSLELQVEEERKFSFKIQDAQTGEIVSDLTIIKDIQWSYSESDYISYTLDSNRIILTVKGVKATETPNEIYVTVNGVKSNVCTVTVKDFWENKEVVITYGKSSVEKFELPLQKERHLSVLLRDKNTKEFITPPPTKDGIQWTYPQNDRGITYATDLAAYGDVLTLIGEREVTEPQEIFVTINEIRSESCMVTVGKYYSVENSADLKAVINKVGTSDVTEIHIEGSDLVSSASSLIKFAQELSEKDASGKKYTLDLTAATDVDLSNRWGDILFTSSIEHVLLPEGLTTIGENAFWGFMALANITIPSQVTTIGKAAFGSCFALKEIVIPASVEFIDEHAFSYCTGLEKIRFEPRDKKLEIAAGAFAGLASKVGVILDKETAGLITGAGAKNILGRVPQP